MRQRACTAVLALVTLTRYAASSLITTVPQPTFVAELKEPKYVVAMRTKPSVQTDQEGHTARTVTMTDTNGKRFQCHLPDGGEDEGMDSADKPIDASKAPSELLDTLGTSCFFRVEGWWTYELCYNKHVRQFHQEREAVTSEFFLGHYDAAATHAYQQRLGQDYLEEAGSTGAQQRFHVHIYTNGTECDLTRERRQTEVRFACSSESTNNLLVSIKEPTTCHYTLIFYTPMLCANHHFKQQEHPVRYINCHATHEEAEAEAAAEACASDP